MSPDSGGPLRPNAVRDLVDADRELALLRELIQAASSGPGVEPLAAAAARMITAATATDVCFVHVLDDSDRSLTLAGATPPFDSEIGKIRLPLGSGVSGWVASHREPVVITHDKESDPRYMPFQSLRGSDFTSMVSVPMETDPGGLVGVLNVHTVARREFTARDVELLLVIGRLIAGALHQARLHRQLVARERAHENFVEQVIEAQEIERRRLAADIHDGISQRLVTLSYRLDAASRAVGSAPATVAEQLNLARELVALTLGEARAAISGLRPPVLDDLGLSGGLASLARSVPGVAIVVELADTRLPDHIELALYRIAQECLQNVVKHARATNAQLTFTVGEDVARLEIADNGIGFDTFEHPLGADEMGGYGLLSMAERAEIVGGRLNIRSRPGTGTSVTATIPLPASATDPARVRPSTANRPG
jgi:signal transduction histidine kinase